MIFKYKELIEFYKQILNKGQTQLFKDWNGEKVFLIRHDVDFDVKLAHDMALIENKLGIFSTFFFLTSSHSYNILSKENRSLLREINEMGHEIGLHFDPTLYRKDLNVYAEKEASILSLACGNEVKSISLHNPSVHGQYPLFEKYVNAYDPSMFSDSNYISDSRFSFGSKNPFEFINSIKDSMIQILLHPMHFSEAGWGYDKIFMEAFKFHINTIHKNFQVNSTYNKQVGNNIIKKLKNNI